jgi:hypothetical protein
MSLPTTGGRAVGGGSSIRCLDVNDAGGHKSECTADGTTHRVYIDEDVPSNFAYYLTLSVQQDYDSNPNIYALIQSSLTDTTDVRVQSVSIATGTPWIYTTCSGSASYGGGSGYYRWCRRQLLRFDPTRANGEDCLADPSCMGWIACHELGHTLGLQHPGTYPNENSSSRVTCMEYAGQPGNPDAHDREHLEDCIPHPTPPPTNLTSACKNYDG